MKIKDTVELLKHLVAIPSVSREEKAKADFLFQFLSDKGCEMKRIGNNLWTSSDHFDVNKPSILLNSHIDTVKPNVSWSTDPFVPLEQDGKIFALGANDAHASVVSLITTFLRFKSTPQAYNLILGLSCEEEVSGKAGVESLLKELPKIDFALVGEPTGMQMAVAEKGLMVLDCTSKGVAGHAAREEGDNAIYHAIDDINWFRNYRFKQISESLGEMKMSVTQVEAGTQHNVVPDVCRFVVDVRLTDAYTHEEALQEIRKSVQCKVEPRSVRLKSSGIALSHPITVAYKQAGGLSTFGSSTMSDQALMDFPSVKMGPGESARSHTANEFIKITEIEQACIFYANLLDGFKL